MACSQGITEGETKIILSLRHDKISKQNIANAVSQSKEAVQNFLNNSNKSNRKYTKANNRELTIKTKR